MKQVGKLSNSVVNALGLNMPVGTPIFIGASNIEHMRSRHPTDYAEYGKDIAVILGSPDYVGINPKDNSIEFVKEYKINNEFVKVAVRVSGGGTLYARSVYILNSGRVQNYIAKGTLKRI